MASVTQSCKHKVLCYYIGKKFHGCEKCLHREKLWMIRPVLTPSANMSDNSINPFSKNTKTNRSPPPTPTPPYQGTPAKTSEGEISSMETEGTGEASLPQKRENLIQALLHADLSTVQTDPNIDPNVKSYITNAKDAISFLVGENKNFHALLYEHENKFLQSQAENKKIIENLQAQINSVSNPPSTSGVKTNNFKQAKLDFKKMAKPSANNQKITNSTKKSFSALPVNVETENEDCSVDSEDDTEDEEEEQEFNSDPEFKKMREKARKTRKLKKKMKKKEKTPTANGASKDTNSKDDQTPQKDNKSKEKKPRPPPPIKVIGKIDYNYLKNVLKSGSKEEHFSLKYINEDSCKINPHTEEAFRGITSALKEEKATNPNLQFYTHENKNSRNIKVLCRGLAPDTPIPDIIEDLKSKEFRILNATCLLKKILVDVEEAKTGEVEGDPKSSSSKDDNKIPEKSSSSKEDAAKPEKAELPKKLIKEMKTIKLPLHQLEFEPAEDIEKVYAIKGILHQIIKIEPLKNTSDTVPQCKRCLAFGHTINYCEKNPKCVKCAGKHLTTECQLPKRIINPRCANCGAIGHPASYRGCPFAKEFALARKQALKKGKSKENPPKKGSPPPLNDKNSTKAKQPKKLVKSFSEVLSGEQAQAQKPAKTVSYENSDLINTLLQTIAAQSEQLRLLTERLIRLETQLSGNFSMLEKSK